MTITIIGPATLILGDAYEIRPTLGWFDADCMDPPYAFNNSGGGAFRKARGASDQIVAERLDKGFDPRIINPLLCGACVVFAHDNQLAPLKALLDGLFHRAVLCVWIKQAPSPNNNKHYLADMECYIHAWDKGFHPPGGYHENHRWVTASSMPSKVFDHPTVKPAPVMAKIMGNLAGQSVCDPFMGTGSTGVAALRAGKRFTGIEHNPTHYATAVRRISDAWAGMAGAAA